MLNALLAEAIPEAIKSGELNLKKPETFVQFLEFTDDHVMSAVMHACLRSRDRGKAYDRALVHRDLPMYLGNLDLTGDASHDDMAVNDERDRYAKSVLGKKRDGELIRTWRVESALLKGGGMPYVLERDKATGGQRLKGPGDAYQIMKWSRERRLPATVKSCHFFVDRDRLNS
jgi:hypothetical protein